MSNYDKLLEEAQTDELDTVWTAFGLAVIALTIAVVMILSPIFA